jgi:hypothetical protein
VRLPSAQLVFALFLVSAVNLACNRARAPIAASNYADSPAAEAPAAEAAPAGGRGNNWPAAAAQSPGSSGASARAKADDSYQGSARDAEHEQSAAPERRPGLSTRWGERRDSSVQEVNFVRDHSDPFAVLSFQYDDEDGVSYKTGRDADDALPSVFSVRGGAIEVSIVSSGDDPLPQLQARGKTYIVGDTDDRYAIRLTNFTRERYEVVASVDGLDVLTGSEAHYQQRGYILAPWSTLHIEGFRESADSVRAFRFGDIRESYAIGRGYGRDIGVIGVALFDEQTTRQMRGNEPSPFPGEYAPPPRY